MQEEEIWDLSSSYTLMVFFSNTFIQNLIFISSILLGS